VNLSFLDRNQASTFILDFTVITKQTQIDFDDSACFIESCVSC
jgi:hypothetical protein